MGVAKKKYALRRNNGVTRVVQCHEGRKGLVYSSDRKKCSAQTFTTKSAAKSALQQRFGRRKSKVTKRKLSSSYGKRSTKKNQLKKYYVICHDPEDPEKVKICRGYKINYDGETHQIVKFGSGYDSRYYLIDNDDVKFFSEKQKKSGKLKLMKKKYGILNSLPALTLTLLPSEELLSKGITNASGTINHGVIGGSRTKLISPPWSVTKNNLSSTFKDNSKRRGLFDDLKGVINTPITLRHKDRMKRSEMIEDTTGKYDKFLQKIQKFRHDPDSSLYQRSMLRPGLPRSPSSVNRRGSISPAGFLTPSPSPNFGRTHSPNLLARARAQARRNRMRFGQRPQSKVNYGFSRYF